MPDFRDWTRQELTQRVQRTTAQKHPGRAPNVTDLARILPANDEASSDLPCAFDLRDSGWLPPVSEQQSLGSCTAHAVTTMVEALHNRLGRKPLDLSRLFLYKVTRNLHGFRGDSGASLRTTIKALRLFGVPPEHLWPYDTDRFEIEPEAFHYAFASNYKATMFARLDAHRRRAPAADAAAQTLDEIRRVLVHGTSAALGFSVYSNIDRSEHRGVVPLPSPRDSLIGGHAVVVVGYDDHAQVVEGRPGALVFQNSWGEAWGDGGFGYLPYEFVRLGIAWDVWTVTNSDWVSESVFA